MQRSEKPGLAYGQTPASHPTPGVIRSNRTVYRMQAHSRAKPGWQTLLFGPLTDDGKRSGCDGHGIRVERHFFVDVNIRSPQTVCIMLAMWVGKMASLRSCTINAAGPRGGFSAKCLRHTVSTRRTTAVRACSMFTSGGWAGDAGTSGDRGVAAAVGRAKLACVEWRLTSLVLRQTEQGACQRTIFPTWPSCRQT